MNNYILIGAVGGLIPDVIRLVKNRYSVEMPGHWKSPNFYVGLAALVVLGGLAAWLGGADDVKTALAFGFGAPELVSRILSSNNPGTLSAGGSLHKIGRWWSF